MYLTMLSVEPHEMVVKLRQATKIKLNPRGLHHLMWFYHFACHELLLLLSLIGLVRQFVA